MFFLRLVGILLLITIAVSLLTYLLTGDRRYLRFAWQVVKYAFAVAVLVLVFLFVDRLLMAV